jgi:cell division protein FtsB
LEWERRTLYERVRLDSLEQDSLRTVIQALETDSLMIERLAREKYGMVRPGERVLIVNEPPTEQKK